jgi:hypothetical protein
MRVTVSPGEHPSQAVTRGRVQRNEYRATLALLAQLKARYLVIITPRHAGSTPAPHPCRYSSPEPLPGARPRRSRHPVLPPRGDRAQGVRAKAGGAARDTLTNTSLYTPALRGAPLTAPPPTHTHTLTTRLTTPRTTRRTTRRTTHDLLDVLGAARDAHPARVAAAGLVARCAGREGAALSYLLRTRHPVVGGTE